MYHTFGSTNTSGVACGDDYVDDTPTTKGSPETCDLSMSECSEGVIENVENHMNYGNCPKMFTDGQAERVGEKIITGIEDSFSENRLKIWPNPARDVITIGQREGLKTTISIYDITSRLVIEKTISGLMEEINISELIPGIYMINTRSENGIKEGKLLISR